MWLPLLINEEGMASKGDASERKRVVLVGQVNSGKSTLYNRLLRQERSLVSDQTGTTTDSVEELFKLSSVKPALLVDTPGLADEAPPGVERQRITQHALGSVDLILYLLSCEESLDTPVITALRKASVPTLPIIIRADLPEQSSRLERQEEITRCLGHTPLILRQDDEKSLGTLFGTIKRTPSNESEPAPSLLDNLCQAGNLMLLVVSRNSSAPAGRLILSQVQAIRTLLDRGCHALCVTPEQFPAALPQLATPPQLIITDSQVFTTAESLVPEDYRLTSFPIPVNAQRDDLQRLVTGARAIGRLAPASRIFIAETCTHAPEGGGIGTVKLPRLLREHISETLTIEHVSGRDFPEDLTPYNPTIHCGGCMLNHCMPISRQDLTTAQQVPMTNYRLAMAYLAGILDKVTLP